MSFNLITCPSTIPLLIDHVKPAFNAGILPEHDHQQGSEEQQPASAGRDRCGPAVRRLLPGPALHGSQHNRDGDDQENAKEAGHPVGWSIRVVNRELNRIRRLLHCSKPFESGRHTGPKIGRFAGVAFTEAIEVFKRPGLGHLHHRAAHFEGAQGLARVIAQQRDLGVQAHVLLLAEAAHGIDQHMPPIKIAPDDRSLWLAIGHNRRQSRHGRAVDQVKVRVGYLGLQGSYLIEAIQVVVLL